MDPTGCCLWAPGRGCVTGSPWLLVRSLITPAAVATTLPAAPAAAEGAAVCDPATRAASAARGAGSKQAASTAAASTAGDTSSSLPPSCCPPAVAPSPRLLWPPPWLLPRAPPADVEGASRPPEGVQIEAPGSCTCAAATAAAGEGPAEVGTCPLLSLCIMSAAAAAAGRLLMWFRPLRRTSKSSADVKPAPMAAACRAPGEAPRPAPALLGGCLSTCWCCSCSG